MLLHRTTPLALAILALACEPSVPYHPENNPASVDYAGFDPTGSPPLLPLPNQLALEDQAIAAQNPSQAAVLKAFKAAGGFPNDQEVPITIPFVRININPDTGAQTKTVPPLDVTSINSNTLLILSISNQGGFSTIAYDPPKAGDYDSTGVLTLHKTPPCALTTPNSCATGGKTTRRWDPATYVVAVRGGASGVQVTGRAAGVKPQAAMYLLESCTPTCPNGKGLTDPLNQGLLPGTREEKAAAAAQLETVRKGYLVPFLAVDASGKFTHNDVATMGVFKVADVQTHVETDPSSGAIPLPSDFLMDATGHLSTDGQAAFNAFAAGLGTGLASLDGFSTTAMLLAQTSGAIDAFTVNGNTVFLYELNLTTGTATRMLDVAEALGTSQAAKAQYVAEPPQVTQTLPGATCGVTPATATRSLSTVIGLQPGVPVPVPGGLLPVPPLKENTTYVVLISDGVKDINCSPLTRSTLGKLLLLDPSLKLSKDGKTLVAGPTDAQAVGLDVMRGAINLAAGTLAAEKPALTRDHIVMAYTFHTQSMKSAAVSLTALPYSTGNATLAPVGTPKLYGVCLGTPCPDGTIAAEFDAYGLDQATVPKSNIGAIVDATILTFNNLDDISGAFNDPTKVPPTPTPIPAVIALPPIPVPGTNCIPTPTAPCKIPLVIFRHGLNGGRGDMLPIADTLNAQGLAVAAIDAPKHGDRSFCNADAQCASGATCQPIAAMANQGDAPGPTPGACKNGSTAADFKRRPVLCPTGGCATATFARGIPLSSGNFLVGLNFFRTRDTLRQDLIDESQLIRALSPDPASDSGNLILSASTGFIIDHTKIWFVGQSLGSISGTVDVAANPRISKAAFSVGGGTIVDIFTNSPSFATAVGALLASKGIVPGTAGYLQFLTVAKWVLDPADPINFAVNLSTQTLPSPLSGNVAPPARAVMAQLSNCDLTVPNPFNAHLGALSGLGPAGGGTSTLEAFTHSGSYATIGQTSCQAGGTAVPEAAPGGGAVPHGILTNWGTVSGVVSPSLNLLTSQAQGDVATFLTLGTKPPAVRNAAP